MTDLSKVNYFTIYLYLSFFAYQTRIVGFFIAENIVFFSLVAFFLAYRVDFTRYKKDFIIFVILFFYSALTLVYAPDKVEAVQRIISLGLLVFFVFFVLYDEVDKKYIDESFLHMIVINAFYVYLSFVLYESLLDYRGEFIGFVKNRHNISFLLGVYFVMILSYVFNKRSLFVLFLLLPVLYYNIYLIYYSFGRVGFFVIGVFLVVSLILKVLKLSFMRRLFVLFLALIVFVQSLSLLFDNDVFRYLIEGGMTGREEASLVIFNLSMLNPFVFFTGYGAGALEVIGSDYVMVSVRDVNNIVAVIFEYGFMGLLLYLYMFFSYLYKAFFLAVNTKYIDYYTLIPVPIMFVPSEATWLNFNNFETIVMYVFIGYTLRQYYCYKKGELRCLVSP